MPLLTWNDDYSVGVKQIDDDHKKLLEMINKAYASAEAGVDEDITLADLVADMIKYAQDHFATEARLMKEYNYPNATQHQLEHGDFTARAIVSGGTLSQEWSLDPIKIFRFLADWLTNHIMKTDKELGKFLNEHGVK